MIRVGFEPTPFRTSALSWRLRPLGHLTFVEVSGLAKPFMPLGEILVDSKQLGAIYYDFDFE